MEKKRIFSLLALVLSLTILLGAVPVSAASSVTISKKNAKYTVSAGKTIKKIVVKSSAAEIILEKRASVKELIVSKKGCKLTINAGSASYADITLSKKTALSIKGEKDSNINITAAAAGSKVTTSVPVNLYAKKNASVVLENGSEDSIIDKSSKKIKVNITDKSGSSGKSDDTDNNTSGNKDSAGIDLSKEPPAPDELRKLTDKAEDKKNVTLTLNEGNSVLKTREQVRDYINKMSKDFIGFSIAVEFFDLMSDPSYYLKAFPSLNTIEFSDAKIYKNCCSIRCSITKKISTTDEEFFDINNALVNGYTGYLSKNEKELYNLIFEIAGKTKGESEYETVKNIHDYLVSTIAYNKYASGNVYSVRNALVVRECVCSGYALAFLELCQAAGLDVIYVTGDAVKNGSGELHAWNKVKIDDKWYSIDCTWDDPVPDSPGEIKYNYFLITDEDMAVNHKWDNDGLPKAKSKDLGIVYQEYADTKKFSSEEEALKYVKEEIEKTRTNASGGFTFEMEFLYSGSRSIRDDLKDILSYYHDTFGCGGAYNCNDKGFLGYLGYIKIFRSY